MRVSTQAAGDQARYERLIRVDGVGANVRNRTIIPECETETSYTSCISVKSARFIYLDRIIRIDVDGGATADEGAAADGAAPTAGHPQVVTMMLSLMDALGMHSHCSVADALVTTKDTEDAADAHAPTSSIMSSTPYVSIAVSSLVML